MGRRKQTKVRSGWTQQALQTVVGLALRGEGPDVTGVVARVARMACAAPHACQAMLRTRDEVHAHSVCLSCHARLVLADMDVLCAGLRAAERGQLS